VNAATRQRGPLRLVAVGGVFVGPVEPVTDPTPFYTFACLAAEQRGEQFEAAVA
jgi:hypothetical protein